MAKEEKDYEVIIRRLAFLEDRVKKLEALIDSHDKKLKEQRMIQLKEKRALKKNKL
jgi:hypothetical protein